MNYFKLYIGDYQRDTAHLSMAEHGAYLLMLQHYYATEKPLPAGKALHRMLRAQDKIERDAIDAIAAQFWTETPEGLQNERAYREISKAREQAETNARTAKAREAKRKAERERHEHSTNRATNHDTKEAPYHSHSHNQTVEAQRLSRDSAPATSAGAIAKALRAADIEVTSQNPVLLQWIADGFTAEQLAEAVEIAKARKPGERIPAKYLDAIVRSQASQKPGANHEAHQRADNSAVARVHRATAAVLDGEGDGPALAAHDGNVRA